MEDIDDTEFVATEHDRLISAVSKLDKTQHITDPTRNEPTNLNSEFNLIKSSNKLNIKNVVKILEDTAHHVQISKKLDKSQDKSKVLSKPLEKPQAERIKRATGYEQTKTKVGRWDPVVARSRTVDYVSFPLKRVDTRLQPTEDFLSKLKLKSPLEKELDEIDPPPLQEVEDEEEPMYPMSYEEMVVHRQHLAKLRAQQSYNAAKAKRQSKIKSKKYHRILKKEKLKEHLKEFEELQKKDPEEALKKLEVLEKTRALERHTLRHKNTGKWAKSKLVRAKYDKEVRQQLAEQLAVSRGLTKKTENVDSSDDEVDANENIANITLAQDPMHPWMVQRSDKSNVNSEFDFGYKKYIKDKMYKRKEDRDNDSDAEQVSEEILIDTKSATVDFTSLKVGIGNLLSKNNSCNDLPNESPIDMQEPVKNKRKAKKVIKLKSKVVATTNWVVESKENLKINKKQKNSPKNFASAFESYESKISGRVEKKLKKLRSAIRNLEKGPNSKSFDKKCHNEDETNNLDDLKLKNQRIRPIIDEELIETGSKDVENTQPEDKPLQMILNSTEASTNEQANGSDIDTSRFTEAKPKYLHTALPDDVNDMDQLDDDEQVVPKVNIEEVFEEEDVVASFRQEKEEEINKDKPQDIDLSLPGWGSWGGKGVKAPKRKRNRFILKAPPKVPRRDENKGDIIITEYKNPKLASHKVSELPYPFTSIKEYEASIRAPLGNTFVPGKAHQKLIRPNVITKAGTIIEPMDEEELLVPKNRNYKNTDVISLTSKK